MDNLTRKKIVLSLLDSDPKSANEIANEIGESLATVEDQLTPLASENICEETSQNEASQYAIKKDIETFARLVKVFLSDNEEHDEETKQFITFEYYFDRIDCALVDYVLKRFYLDSVYQADDEKESIRRVLLASPSALFFTLHGNTASFREFWNQLDSSDGDQDLSTRIFRSQFMVPLLEMLTADMRVNTYASLYHKLNIWVAKTEMQVSLATPNEKYVEVTGRGFSGFFRLVEDSQEDYRLGASVTFVDPMDFFSLGSALLHLGEFQAALKNFDDALDEVQDPIQRAKVLNNKGWTFLRLAQYQKAIECFEKGIVLDSEGELSVLCENKQLAEEYLARATDADNLTAPTQIPFVQGQPVPFEETRLYEFKEIGGGNAIRSIGDTSDIYAVAFLNHEKGGRIFWGIRNKDRITIGVPLNEQQRDDLRVKVSEKLGAIQPSIVGHWQLELHPVYDLQRETLEDLWVIEILVPPPQRREVFYTGKGELYVKTVGGKKKLLGPAVTEFIRSRLQNETETA